MTPSSAVDDRDLLLITWASKAAIEEFIGQMLAHIGRERFEAAELQRMEPMFTATAARLRGEQTMCDVVERRMTTTTLHESVQKKVRARAEAAARRLQQRRGA